MNKRLFLITLLFYVATAWPTLSASAGEDGKHLFILSGQSNMRQPLPDTFTRCVEQVFGKDSVVVVTVARPSQPIKLWYKDWQPPEGMSDEKPQMNGTLYESLLKATRKAIGEKPIATATYIWMQGEADAGNGWGSVYEKSFFGVLDQLKQELEIDGINFVVGRINDFWVDPERFPDGKLIRRIQQQLGEDHANGDWVNTDDLNRGVNPWGGYSFEDGHFPPPSYRVMGQRFAKKACRLIDPKIKLDPEVFKEAFFDSSDDIQSHGAVGKAVTGTAPQPRDADGPAGLAALTDGKFAKPDHRSEHWLGFAPREETTELIVDLGEVMAIDAIAVSTLISSQAKAEFPKQFVFSISEDGKAYTVNASRYNTIRFANHKSLREMRSKGIEPQAILLLAEQRQRNEVVQARYIKVEFQSDGQWVYLDEIVVNPSMK